MVDLKAVEDTHGSQFYAALLNILQTTFQHWSLGRGHLSTTFVHSAVFMARQKAGWSRHTLCLQWLCCLVVLYSDYVFNLPYCNCIDSAEFGQAEHWNLFCLDIQHQECLDFHLKKGKGKRRKKEMQQQPHLMRFHHFAAYLYHLDTSFCSGVFPLWRRQAAFTMDMPESFLTVSSNERCFKKDCIYPDPVACVFMSLLDASPHLVI